MTAVLAEMGGRLAERWAAMLILPGVLFTLGAAGAWRLGHAHWADLDRLSETVDELEAGPAWSVLVVGLPVLSVLAALAARSIAAGLSHLWFERWPKVLARLGTRLSTARGKRWTAAQEAFAKAKNQRATKAQRDEIDALAGSRNAIALLPPSRPTWMGDRLRAVDQRVWSWYKLDLVFSWPRLWLVLEETEQETLRAARGRIDTAVGLAGWGVLCLVPAWWWWPAALVAVGLFVVGHRQARVAVDAFAHLAESIYDLRGATLARELGFTVPEGPLPPHVGEQVTAHLRKLI